MNTIPARHAALPPGLVPRGLSRAEAAAYVGVSAGHFDKLVTDGTMPAPKQLRGRLVWDRVALDRAFSDLPDASGDAPPAGDDVWDRARV